MQFIDEVVIYIRSGKGGDGCVSFRRETNVPRGGPNGGDGGKGGDVVFVADSQLSTLLDLKYQKHHFAEDGHPGEGKQKSGRSGKDIIVRVPVGTLICDADDDSHLCDLTEDGQTFIAAKGGAGGAGNQHFATPTRQAPRFAKPGKPGEEKTLRLILKLIADVGIVGMPNAGKSTLISVISKARPKIADYPFTTLVPHLGVASAGPEQSFVIADIPGLLPGASEGAGLGHRFLRHIERCSIILHLITANNEGDDPFKNYEAINEELRKFSPKLAEKPQIVALNKIDLLWVEKLTKPLSRKFAKKGIPFTTLSAATAKNTDDLVKMLWRQLKENRSIPRRAEPYDPLKIG
ncbi:MAG: GTPase ObgE [Myxococcota bacterium]